jgi:hypothetical protein
VKTYSPSVWCFRAARIARISASLRCTLARSSSISCGVRWFGAVGGPAVGFGCFGMAYHRRAPRQTPERDTASRETPTGFAITGIAMISSGTGTSKCCGRLHQHRHRLQRR